MPLGTRVAANFTPPAPLTVRGERSVGHCPLAIASSEPPWTCSQGRRNPAGSPTVDIDAGGARRRHHGRCAEGFALDQARGAPRRGPSRRAPRGPKRLAGGAVAPRRAPGSPRCLRRLTAWIPSCQVFRRRLLRLGSRRCPRRGRALPTICASRSPTRSRAALSRSQRIENVTTHATTSPPDEDAQLRATSRRSGARSRSSSSWALPLLPSCSPSRSSY